MFFFFKHFLEHLNFVTYECLKDGIFFFLGGGTILPDRKLFPNATMTDQRYSNLIATDPGYFDRFPTKDMQTTHKPPPPPPPPPVPLRSGHLYIKDAECAESNEKSYISYFRF